MTDIGGKKEEWTNHIKKVLSLAAVTSALAMLFLAAAFFYLPSRTDAVPLVGYENALSPRRLDDTNDKDVTSGDGLPAMMSFRISD